MLLLIFLGLWVLVVDDQVNLVGGTTLIRTKHDNIWGGVGELILVESLVVSQTVSIGVRIQFDTCDYSFHSYTWRGRSGESTYSFM